MADQLTRIVALLSACSPADRAKMLPLVPEEWLEQVEDALPMHVWRESGQL